MTRLMHIPLAVGMAMLQSLPLRLVAWLGRQVGGVAWWVCFRRRRQALVNLDIAFGREMPFAERRRVGRASFRLVGEGLLCALRTAIMDRKDLESRLLVVGLGKLRPWVERSDVRGIVVAAGHFGNLEAYAHASQDLPWMRSVCIYRRTGGPAGERVLDRVRHQAPGEFFEATRQETELRKALREGNIVLGLLGDSGEGPGGVAVPFFGCPASTAAAPAVYALRFRMPLYGAACFRTGPGRWRVEVSDEIPTRTEGRPRRVEEILADLNAYVEQSIRRDPANWYWMLPRWEHTGKSRRKVVRTTSR